MENLAEEWATKCKFEHPDETQYPQYKMIGQNIAAMFGAPSVTYVFLATQWRDEVQYYTYSSNTCASNHQCGHYKQVSQLPLAYVVHPCGLYTCLFL